MIRRSSTLFPPSSEFLLSLYHLCRSDVFGLFFSIVYLKDAFSVAAVFPVTIWCILSFFSYVLDARIKTVALH